jgi:hypothetical protein
MSDDDLARRVHRNLMEVTSWMAGDGLHLRDGELFGATASDLPFLNIAMREATDEPAGDFLAAAREFFSARGRGFVVYAQPADPELERAAVADGFYEVLPRYPEMVCRAPLPELPGDIRRVETPADAAAYWAICDEAYPSLGMPAGLFTETFPADGLLLPGIQACLGYLDDRPVACANIAIAEGVGMVGWVGALPEARGRGLAAACTVWATNQAFASGADVASLQASEMGEPIYERLGYEHLFAYRLLGTMPA